MVSVTTFYETPFLICLHFYTRAGLYLQRHVSTVVSMKGKQPFKWCVFNNHLRIFSRTGTALRRWRSGKEDRRRKRRRAGGKNVPFVTCFFPLSLYISEKDCKTNQQRTTLDQCFWFYSCHCSYKSMNWNILSVHWSPTLVPPIFHLVCFCGLSISWLFLELY